LTVGVSKILLCAMVYRRRPSVAVSDEGFEADEVVSYEDNDMDLDDEQDEEGGGAVVSMSCHSPRD
jgi:hypothetical protein